MPRQVTIIQCARPPRKRHASLRHAHTSSQGRPRSLNTSPYHLFFSLTLPAVRRVQVNCVGMRTSSYEGRTERHEQQFFACELGTADEGEYCRR